MKGLSESVYWMFVGPGRFDQGIKKEPQDDGYGGQYGAQKDREQWQGGKREIGKGAEREQVWQGREGEQGGREQAGRGEPQDNGYGGQYGAQKDREQWQGGKRGAALGRRGVAHWEGDRGSGREGGDKPQADGYRGQ